MRGTALEIGGKTLEIQVTLTVRKDAIPLSSQSADSTQLFDQNSPTADQDILPPHPGDVLTDLTDNRDYRIASVDEDGTGTAWRIHLISKDAMR